MSLHNRGTFGSFRLDLKRGKVFVLKRAARGQTGKVSYMPGLGEPSPSTGLGWAESQMDLGAGASPLGRADREGTGALCLCCSQEPGGRFSRETTQRSTQGLCVKHVATASWPSVLGPEKSVASVQSWT